MAPIMPQVRCQVRSILYTCFFCRDEYILELFNIPSHIHVEIDFLQIWILCFVLMPLGNFDFENIEEQAEGIFGGR